MSRPSLVVLFSFLLILILDVKTLLGGAFQLLTIKFFELLHCVLIDRVNHVENLETLLAQSLQERGRGNGCDALTSDVVDVILALLHAIDILLEADLLITRLRSVVAHELSNFGPVGRVLVNSKLDVLGELLIELLVIVLLFSNLRKHFQAFLHQVLLDHTQYLVLLQSLTRDVQWQVLGIHNALDERKPLWHEFITIIHDEDTTHVKLDVRALLLALKHVEWSTARDKE